MSLKGKVAIVTGGNSGIGQTAEMSIDTLSFVMIFCEGICIVTVRKDHAPSAGRERR
jgi:hypothetical protein